jgi:hypothetical protein
MPGLNRRGPEGQGPRTGRGLGRCNSANKGKTDEEIEQARQDAAPFNQQGNGEPQANSGNGGGNGRGRVRGMGRRCRNGRGRGMNS